MSKKTIRTLSIIVLAVIGWFVAAHFFGPRSEHAIRNKIERLQSDSIALQASFIPQGQYDFVQDVYSEVNKLRDYGDPLRSGHTTQDSMDLYSDPRTAKLANYNIAKCDSILKDVLPLWRATASFAIGRELRYKHGGTFVVRDNKNYQKYSGLEIYSQRYISKDAIEEDASRFNSYLSSLGYKSVIYSFSPESVGIEYTFD